MKIKKSKLKNIIENFLREDNPYNAEEESDKMDQYLKDSEKEIERDMSISHRSKKIRKQGVKIKPLMLKAMMKDYRKLVLFLIDARDKLEKSNPDRAKLILDIRKIYDAAKDIQNGNNADALEKFSADAISQVTYDLLKKNSRPRKDFIEIQKTIKLAVKAGPAAANKIDSENFLLSPTQDELEKKKEEEEEEKQKDTSKIKDSKKQNINDIQDMLIELGATDYENNKLTADGVWGAKSRSAFSKFLVAIKDSYKGTEVKQTTLTETTIDFDKLSTGKRLEKKGVWQQAAMEMSGKKDQYVAANNVLSEILAMDIEVDMKGGSAKEEEKNTARTKDSDPVWHTDRNRHAAPADFVDYQENTPVPLNNVSLDHPGFGAEKMIFLDTSSAYSSYSSRRSGNDSFANLNDFLKYAADKSRIGKLSNVPSLSGDVLYKELEKSESTDANGAKTYKFASDVHLEWHMNVKPEAKLKDGKEIILFINGPMKFNYYVKGYKYDAIKNMIVQK